MRVLKWILDRAHGRTNAQETVIGWVPVAGDIDLTGLDVPKDSVAQASRIDMGEWQLELEDTKEWFDKLGKTLPAQLELERQLLLASVKNARAVATAKK
jgi:phosphoenolpyruvate carboxykinase (GTP)